ncbi:MAG: hypothetical protein JEZ02_03640 [Desulfatibacillum sp.]|nr:hypothetical protein [Desulfatibacillum sp.]
MIGISRKSTARFYFLMSFVIVVACLFPFANAMAAVSDNVAEAILMVTESNALIAEAEASADPAKLQEALQKANDAAALLAGQVEGATGEDAQALMDAYVQVQSCLQNITNAAQAIAAASTDPVAVGLADSLKAEALAAVTANNAPMQTLLAAGATLPGGATMEAYQAPGGGGFTSLGRPGTIGPGGGLGGGGGTGGDSPASPVNP